MPNVVIWKNGPVKGLSGKCFICLRTPSSYDPILSPPYTLNTCIKYCILIYSGKGERGEEQRWANWRPYTFYLYLYLLPNRSPIEPQIPSRRSGSEGGGVASPLATAPAASYREVIWGLRSVSLYRQKLCWEKAKNTFCPIYFCSFLFHLSGLIDTS